MTELFVAVSDALARQPALPVYLVEFQRRPDRSRPPYLPEAPAQTPAEYAGSLAKLGKLGIVRSN